jgi:hypothetical protein
VGSRVERMIWLKAAACLVTLSLAAAALFEVYARILKLAGHWPQYVKFPVTLAVYIMFSFALIMPLMAIDWRALIGIRGADLTLIAVFYFLALIPGLTYFLRVHLRSLQRLGYFRGVGS